MSDLVVRAPAKVNLFLRVLAREASGFHQIETLFQGLELHDTVRVERHAEPRVILEVDGSENLGPVERNLAFRAARAYRERAGLADAPGVRILLEKTIPAGAGLGGGSSDAAAVLRALDRLHVGALRDADLLDLAASLGSDVPFFLGPSPLALGWGRGERILGLPALEPRPVLLVMPSFRTSTADAYAELARVRRGEAPGAEAPETEAPGAEAMETEAPRALARTLDHLSSWAAVARRAANDFEAVTLPVHPEAREIRALLDGAGAEIALLSGSGSALFGVFPDTEAAERAAGRVERSLPDARVYRTRTLAAWPAASPSGARPPAAP